MCESHTRWVLLFKSIHHVLSAEKIFKEEGVWHDMIPVPRELSSDCNMAILINIKDVETVKGVLTDARVKPIGVFSPGPTGFKDESSSFRDIL